MKTQTALFNGKKYECIKMAKRGGTILNDAVSVILNYGLIEIKITTTVMEFLKEEIMNMEICRNGIYGRNRRRRWRKATTKPIRKCGKKFSNKTGKTAKTMNRYYIKLKKVRLSKKLNVEKGKKGRERKMNAQENRKNSGKRHFN